MPATWVAIGVLGAFAAAVLAMVFQILGKVDGVENRLDAKIDGLRSELKGDIDGLRRSVDQQTVRIDQQTVRIDDLVKDVGTLKGAVDSLGTRFGHLEGHPV